MRGLERIGVGQTAAIYRDGERALKVYMNGSLQEARAEAEKQRLAHAAGLPVPPVFGAYETEEGVVLEMAYAGGSPLLRPGMDREARGEALRMMVAMQCEMHEKSGEGLPGLANRLRARVAAAAAGDAAKRKALARIDRLDTGESRLCHGDFHPLNILRDGDRLTIIDWVDAASGAPLADACRTHLILLQAAPRIAGAYLTRYCAAASAKREQVLAWLLPVAIARMAEKQTEREMAALRRIVDSEMEEEVQ